MITDLMLAELSALVGHNVELLEPHPGRWLVVPVDRTRLRTDFWTAVRTPRSGGVWDAPEAALVGFAAGVDGCAVVGRPAGLLRPSATDCANVSSMVRSRLPNCSLTRARPGSRRRD